MQSNGNSIASGRAPDYAQLSDKQLRAAIRFAVKRLNCLQEDHAELVRVYRDEIAAMRRHLFERLLAGLIATDTRMSTEQSREVHCAVRRCGKHPNEILFLIRATTKGRSDRLDDLTELEATAFLLRLEREV